MTFEQAMVERPARTTTATIDCDIHPMPTAGMLAPYLPARWREHQQTTGTRFRPGYLYPKGAPHAARTDAWPPAGGPPGSDLAFLRRQLLDLHGIEIGILNCLHEGSYERHPEYSAALVRAVNDWTLAEWLEPESRLRSSIAVANLHPELAVAEIDRLGDHPAFVQVLLLVRSGMPLGNRMYWPIYEAALRHGLPIGIHFGGRGGNPLSGTGWPSYYIEDHTAMALAFQAQLVSLICEGVFVRFPSLRVVMLEGGFAWLPPLLRRLDRSWRRFGTEVPWLEHPPSHYAREHVRLSTQPMEEPARPEQLRTVLDQLWPNALLFATDYPHWDFDAPDLAFPVTLPEDLRRAIMHENAAALYRL